MRLEFVQVNAMKIYLYLFDFMLELFTAYTLFGIHDYFHVEESLLYFPVSVLEEPCFYVMP